MKSIERILKALANRRRLQILKCLKSQPRAAVSDLARTIKLSLKATSKHLGILKSADIVESEQEGLLVFYFLNHSADKLARKIIGHL